MDVNTSLPCTSVTHLELAKIMCDASTSTEDLNCTREISIQTDCIPVEEAIEFAKSTNHEAPILKCIKMEHLYCKDMPIILETEVFSPSKIITSTPIKIKDKEMEFGTITEESNEDPMDLLDFFNQDIAELHNVSTDIDSSAAIEKSDLESTLNVSKEQKRDPDYVMDSFCTMDTSIDLDLNTEELNIEFQCVNY
ncbi:Hypothetical predicted protein [Pelobates cultripes]|uniref:Uncharacterized protein n=1 Tax=Pelobates cultripes TaxID=61616 RepID=A0AAD1WDD4_PELCU|nr:Hypothetical predicted protein [Pelobates cultripes]